MPDLETLLKGFSEDLSLKAKTERKKKYSAIVERALREACSSLTYHVYDNELHINEREQLYRFLVEVDQVLGEKIQKVGSDFMRYLSDYLKVEKKVVFYAHAKMFTGYFK